jgi:hypothetical protein
VKTYWLLGEDRALDNALDDKRVVVLGYKASEEGFQWAKQVANAEKEPLEIVGHGCWSVLPRLAPGG